MTEDGHASAHVLAAILEVSLEGWDSSNLSCLVACGEYGMRCRIPSHIVKLIVAAPGGALSFSLTDQATKTPLATCWLPLLDLEPNHGVLLDQWLPLDRGGPLGSGLDCGGAGRLHVVLQYFDAADAERHTPEITARVEKEFRRRLSDLLGVPCRKWPTSLPERPPSTPPPREPPLPAGSLLGCHTTPPCHGPVQDHFSAPSLESSPLPATKLHSRPIKTARYPGETENGLPGHRLCWGTPPKVGRASPLPSNVPSLPSDDSRDGLVGPLASSTHHQKDRLKQDCSRTKQQVSRKAHRELRRSSTVGALRSSRPSSLSNRSGHCMLAGDGEANKNTHDSHCLEQRVAELSLAHDRVVAENEQLRSQLRSATQNANEQRRQLEQVKRAARDQAASLLVLQRRVEAQEVLERQVQQASMCEEEHMQTQGRLQREHALATQQFSGEAGVLQTEVASVRHENLHLQEEMAAYAQSHAASSSSSSLVFSELLREWELHAAGTDAELFLLKDGLDQAHREHNKLEQECRYSKQREEAAIAAETHQKAQFFEELEDYKKKHCELLGQQNEHVFALAQATIERGRLDRELAMQATELAALREIQQVSPSEHQCYLVAEASCCQLHEELRSLSRCLQGELEVACATHAALWSNSSNTAAGPPNEMQAKLSSQLCFDSNSRKQPAAATGQLASDRGLCMERVVTRGRQQSELEKLTKQSSAENQVSDVDREELSEDGPKRARDCLRCALRPGRTASGQYEAVDGDPIDAALAAQICKVPPPVPFGRLSSGRYRFGARACQASLQRGILLLASEGVSPTAYEDFINKYGAAELLRETSLNVALRDAR